MQEISSQTARRSILEVRLALTKNLPDWSPMGKPKVDSIFSAVLDQKESYIYIPAIKINNQRATTLSLPREDSLSTTVARQQLSNSKTKASQVEF